MARKGRKRQPKPSPDQGLAPANFSALNERFYKMSPEDYFSRRLMSLMLWLGFPDGFQTALQNEFSAEGVGVQWRSDLPDDEAEKNRSASPRLTRRSSFTTSARPCCGSTWYMPAARPVPGLT